MNGAFYIGATGLHAQQSALDVVANNITNINTPAFKRSEVHFSELMTADDTGPNRAHNMAMAGVLSDATGRVFTQGTMQQTGQPLDLAINGTGFIELLGAGGKAELWRGGTLKINDDGFLAAPDGTPLKAMISVPTGASSLTITADGVVSAIAPGDTQSRELGKIEVVQIKDLSTVQGLGDGLYALPDDAAASVTTTPGEEGSGALVQGSLENSNVELSDEMVTLLVMQRAYAANAQLVQAGDQLMSIANNLRRA